MKMEGFSLIELIVVIAIVAILATFSMPFTGKVIGQYRSKSEQRTLLNLIIFARETAMADGQTVTLCPSSDKIHCSQDWNLPLIVFFDTNASGIAEDADKLLRVTEPVSYGTLTFAVFPIGNFLQFTEDGFSLNQNGTFQYCAKDQSWQIIINRIGRMRVVEGDGCSS
jgi:type IV fimbrial biogenesis protein FimT